MLGSSFCLSQESEKWKYFEKFTDTQKIIIDSNWLQYFKEDIYAKLDTDNKNVFPIKLDSYGSIYPAPEVLKGVKFNPKLKGIKFHSKPIGQNNNLAFSLFEVFNSDDNRKIIKKNIDDLMAVGKIKASLHALYTELLDEKYYCNKKCLLRSKRIKCMEDTVNGFYTKWDAVHFASLYDTLNKEIDKKNYDRIVFFVHGYNVPYSLANVQLISLKRMLKDSLKIDTDKILFIPLFWTSNANKYCNISTREAFNTTNKTGLTDGGLENGISFMYYSNRAYYAAITFRKLLNRIDTNQQMDVSVFCHSLGATIATSALINTISKLDTKEKIELMPDGKGALKLKSTLKNAMLKEIVEGLAGEPLPKRSIKVFMSAAAVPGEVTFSDISTASFNNKTWFSCLNPNDEMLTKNVANLPYVSRHTMSGSSLGCDMMDARRVKNKIESSSIGRFHIREVSLSVDHDILTYLNQKAYRDFIKDFFNATPPQDCDKLPLKERLKCAFAGECLKLEYISNPYRVNGKVKRGDEWKDFRSRMKIRKGINTIGIPLMNIIFEMESQTFYSKFISVDTRELITSVKDPFLLVLVERAIKEDETITENLFKEKILNEISDYLNLLMKKQYPYYSFETKNKKPVKFVNIKTGNDLFCFTTKNLDRDYTGSFIAEVGTDWLNPLRRRPLKTYQTLFYGFDVFTPAFYDTTKFKKFDSYDSLDRPHASFQYFGWSKCGLSKYNKLRWMTMIKLGRIGGRMGENFQTALHQDISYSQRPKGWDAQIANEGRIGASLETRHEYQFYRSTRRPNRFANLNLASLLETKIGTYMTNASIGLEISNKSFLQNNHHFINHRTKQGVVSAFDHFMYGLVFKGTFVQHNTMLEGYGIINTEEEKDDKYTPKSIYYLQKDLVKRWIWTGNVVLSYTTRYATLFYNWYAFSPETKLGKLNTTDPRVKDIDLSKRWHHFAEVGLTFNIH
jgi:hypothetical protein